MKLNENTLQITLYGDGDKALSYQVEQIFNVEGTEQMYCGAVPVEGDGIIFLRCNLTVNGEKTEITLSDIPDTAEYARVSDAYHANFAQATMKSVQEELSKYDDYISVTDAHGKKKDFIIHTIFEDEANGRSYVAMQEVGEAGNIIEEISLYRFHEKNEEAEIEMIPSDMEYDRVRNLFVKLIENSVKNENES